MIYAMEKSIESFKPKQWTTIAAVGSLALSPFVGSCSAEYQSPEPASGKSMHELGRRIGNGDSVWIAPVAYVDNADGAGSGDIVVRPVVEVNGDPTCQQPGESRQVDGAQVEYYAVKDGRLVQVDSPSDKAARRSNSVDENTVTCVQFDWEVDGFQPGAELPTTMVIDGKKHRVMSIEDSTKGPSTPLLALEPIE